MQLEDCDPVTDHLIVFFEDCHHMKYGTVANDATMATLKVNPPTIPAGVWRRSASNFEPKFTK